MTATTAAGRRGLIPSLVRWHVGLGELGLRLFLLHLLWILGVLAGGAVLGLFPATAAVHSVLRADLVDAARERDGSAPLRRDRLWASFWNAWRSEFGRSQRLGALLVAGWTLLLVDRLVVRAGIGEVTGFASGVLVVLTVLWALVSVVVWPLSAHFTDPLPRLLRMTMVLMAARIPLTLSIAAVLAATLWLWGTLPGLFPVFGILPTCWLVSLLCWRSGALSAPSDPDRTARS